MSDGKRSHGDGEAEVEVEELLRAAEDQVLLNLRLNSHTTSRGSSSLDPDLARRFDALKSHPPPPPPRISPSESVERSLKSHPPPPPPRISPSESVERSEGGGGGGDEEWGRVLGDDLLSRFAALKGSLGPERGGGKSVFVPDLEDSGDEERGGGSDRISEKEVEKVMQWAKDAARLDPSRSDEDEDDKLGSDDDDDDSSEEEKKVREERSKGKGKPRKWFFF